MTHPTTEADASPAGLRLVKTPIAEAAVDPAGGPATAAPSALSADVIDLREAGRSYAAIARELTMLGSAQAQAAFIRGVRLRPRQERTQLVERELRRLDNLEKKIRAGADQDPDKAVRHLGALEKLRSALH